MLGKGSQTGDEQHITKKTFCNTRYLHVWGKALVVEIEVQDTRFYVLLIGRMKEN